MIPPAGNAQLLQRGDAEGLDREQARGEEPLFSVGD